MSDSEFKEIYFIQAIQDFQRARRKADLQEIFSRITGKSTELLSYEEVRQKLHLRESGKKELKEIPLDKIVGSVGRYSDFSRNFLPLQDSAKSRWVSVMVETSSLKGLPPIDVYQIGDVYFVLDGNHRVSVARELGASHIEAYVIPFKTKVPVDDTLQPDDLIIKEEQVNFLETTNLDQKRPDSDLTVTAPGKYPILEEHINVHRYFMGIEHEHFIPFEEAAANWYDTIYQPIVLIIRERGIMRHFPGRTETDLYLWLAEHRAWLSQRLGWDIEPGMAAEDLTIQHGEESDGILSKTTKNIIKSLTFDTLESGPPPGEWRSKRVDQRDVNRLFPDLLVPVTGQDTGWIAVDQAITLAQREGSRIHGIHIVQSKSDLSDDEFQELSSKFHRKCQDAGVEATLSVDEGGVAEMICDHARFTDIVITRLMHPPEDQVFSRLGSGYRTMIQKCPRPLFSVSSKISELSNAVLAFDNSPKSIEALYIAAYMTCNWEIPLTVITVADGNINPERVMKFARKYLHNRPLVNFEIREGDATEEVIHLVEEQHADLVLCGGYSSTPIMEVVFGSLVDNLLREAEVPILICR